MSKQQVTFYVSGESRRNGPVTRVRDGGLGCDEAVKNTRKENLEKLDLPHPLAGECRRLFKKGARVTAPARMSSLHTTYCVSGTETHRPFVRHGHSDPFCEN